MALTTAEQATYYNLLRSLAGDQAALNALFTLSDGTTPPLGVNQRQRMYDLLRSLAGDQSSLNNLFSTSDGITPPLSTAQRANMDTLLLALAGNPAALDALSFGTPTPPAISYPGPVAARSNLNTVLTAVTTPYMSRKFFVATDDITALQVAFPNWSNNGGFVETPSGGVLSVAASIEYPVGTFTQLTFGGATTGTAASGDTLWSDLVTLGTMIPNGATAYLRWFASNTVKMPVGTGTVVPYSGAPQYVAGGDACHSNGTDQTMGGTVVDDGTGVILWHAAIVGMTTKPTFAITGDSKAAGVYDTGDATGGTGELERALAALGYAYINVAIPGDRVTQFINNSSRRMALARLCSHIIVQGSINDISAGRTAAQLLADRQTLRNLAPLRTFFGCTISPKSTSSDSFATVANQTVDVNNGVRQTVNAAVLAGETGYTTPAIDINSFMESATPGKWKAPGYTSDGVHELRAANLGVSLSFTGLTVRAWDVMDASPILRLRGDTGVTSSSGLVSAWADQSPAAIQAAASGALRPTLSTNINGKQCISFDGTQALQVPTFALLGPKRIVIVCKNASPALVEVMPFSLKDTAGTFSEFQFINFSGYKTVSFIFDSPASALASSGYNPVLDTSAHDYAIQYGKSLQVPNQPASYSLTVDGVSQAVAASGSNVPVAGNLGAIGGRLSSGLAISNGFVGDIGEIIIYPRSTLTDLELAQERAYLTAYWGV